MSLLSSIAFSWFWARCVLAFGLKCIFGAPFILWFWKWVPESRFPLSMWIRMSANKCNSNKLDIHFVCFYLNKHEVYTSKNIVRNLEKLFLCVWHVRFKFISMYYEYARLVFSGELNFVCIWNDIAFDGSVCTCVFYFVLKR